MHLCLLWRHAIRRVFTRKLELARSKVSISIVQISRVLTFPIDFTGISAPYEAPESPEIHINTGDVDVTEAVRIIADYLEKNGYINLVGKKDD